MIDQDRDQENQLDSKSRELANVIGTRSAYVVAGT
jgi:hypothetical protein